MQTGALLEEVRNEIRRTFEGKRTSHAHQAIDTRPSRIIIHHVSDSTQVESRYRDQNITRVVVLDY